MLDTINPIKPGTPMPGKVPPPFDPQALAAIVSAMVAHTATAHVHPRPRSASPQWRATVRNLHVTLGKMLDACDSEPVVM